MEAAFGRLHNRRGSPPPFMDSIKLDGNVANVRKTYANTYQIFVHLDISWILLYFPYVFPGAIYLARYSTPLNRFEFKFEPADPHVRYDDQGSSFKHFT